MSTHLGRRLCTECTQRYDVWLELDGDTHLIETRGPCGCDRVRLLASVPMPILAEARDILDDPPPEPITSRSRALRRKYRQRAESATPPLRRSHPPMANEAPRTESVVPYDFKIHRDKVVKFIAEQLQRPNPPPRLELGQLIARELGIRVSDTNIHNLKGLARQRVDAAPSVVPPGEPATSSEADDDKLTPAEPMPEPPITAVLSSGMAHRAIRRRNSWDCPEGSATLEQEEDGAVLLLVNLRLPPKLAFAVNDLLWSEVLSADQEGGNRV